MKKRTLVVNKKVKLNIEKERNKLIVYDTATLVLVMGATSVLGNLSYYGVKKEKNKYIVPIKVVQDRIRTIERNIEKLSNKLDVMKQIVGDKYA